MRLDHLQVRSPVQQCTPELVGAVILLQQGAPRPAVSGLKTAASIEPARSFSLFGLVYYVQNPDNI